MSTNYIAHISNDGERQSVLEHLQNTARLASDFSVEDFKQINYLCGMLHDIGKYSDEFQEHINGSEMKTEHSICGAVEASKFTGKNTPLSLLIQLCVAGHHTGIPDCGSVNDTSDMPTLYGRLRRKTVDFSAFANEVTIAPLSTSGLNALLQKDCKTAEDIVEKFAFFTRYCFSCLTDADSLDTKSFCQPSAPQQLRCDFEKCIASLKAAFGKFKPVSELQKARQSLQKQAFLNITKKSNIYLLNMPTGSGKTLASLYCALKRIQASGGRLKRVIYVIPYNSIIDQTAEIFESLFSDHTDILRHQSSFVYEEMDERTEDYRRSMSAACENWDAGIVITTAVQFFESMYGDKRGKLRKVHNMANSVIVFDEAHLMPREYLEPCLRAISYITKYLNSEALLLTATMPDFKSLLERCTEANVVVSELIKETSEFEKFRKCRYMDLGSVSVPALLQKASEYASSLIVVNSRKKAAEIYKCCSGEKYHLSTYMTAYDRSRVIADIKAALDRLKADYPKLSDVPPDRRITVISTSLIEAGVDLDFSAAFRELAGLDSVLQTGGRCNREGLRGYGDVYVFESEAQGRRFVEQELTKGVLSEFDDISCEAAIKTYYDRLFTVDDKKIHSKSVSRNCKRVNMIPFRTYSDSFKMIDDKRTVSVAVCRDEYSRDLYETLSVTGYINSRKIRKYCCTVYLDEFDSLKNQGVLDDHGSGVFFLTEPSYYDSELGIRFEGKDYII